MGIAIADKPLQQKTKIRALLGRLAGIHLAVALAAATAMSDPWGDQPDPDPFNDQPPPDPFNDQPPPDPFGDQPTPDPFGDQPLPDPFGDQPPLGG